MKISKNLLLASLLGFGAVSVYFIGGNADLWANTKKVKKTESVTSKLEKGSPEFAKFEKIIRDLFSEFKAAAQQANQNEQKGQAEYTNIIKSAIDPQTVSKKICGVFNDEVVKSIILYCTRTFMTGTISQQFREFENLKIVEIQKVTASGKQFHYVINCVLEKADNPINIVIYFSENGKFYEIKIGGVAFLQSIKSQLAPKLAGKSKKERPGIVKKEIENLS
ncbi:MAG: hypothetical protein LBI26_02430 [Holosporales bacterium]|jgi:hypothetical protein|nr:hypothetical protein [Holosporales bacterium]